VAAGIQVCRGHADACALCLVRQPKNLQGMTGKATEEPTGSEGEGSLLLGVLVAVYDRATLIIGCASGGVLSCFQAWLMPAAYCHGWEGVIHLRLRTRAGAPVLMLIACAVTLRV